MAGVALEGAGVALEMATVFRAENAEPSFVGDCAGNGGCGDHAGEYGDVSFDLTLALAQAIRLGLTNTASAHAPSPSGAMAGAETQDSRKGESSSMTRASSRQEEAPA